MSSCSCCTTETTSCFQQWWTWKRLHSMWRLPHFCILQSSVDWNINSERKWIRCFLFLVECWVSIILRERLMWWSIKDDGFEFTCHIFIIKTWFMKVERMHRGTGSLDHDLRWLLGGGSCCYGYAGHALLFLILHLKVPLPHETFRTDSHTSIPEQQETLWRLLSLRVEEEMWIKCFAFTG